MLLTKFYGIHLRNDQHYALVLKENSRSGSRFPFIFIPSKSEENFFDKYFTRLLFWLWFMRHSRLLAGVELFFGNFENHDLPKKSQTREKKVDIYFSRNFDFQLFDSIVSLSNFQVPRSMSHETFLLTILRYCDKKIILCHRFQWPTKVSSYKTYLESCFVYVPWFIFC